MNVVKRNGSDMVLIFLAIGFIVSGLFMLAQDDLKKMLEKKKEEEPVLEVEKKEPIVIVGTSWVFNGNTLSLNEDMTMTYLDDKNEKMELLAEYDTYRFIENTKELVFMDSTGEKVQLVMDVVEFDDKNMTLVYNDLLLDFVKIVSY